MIIDDEIDDVDDWWFMFGDDDCNLECLLNPCWAENFRSTYQHQICRLSKLCPSPDSLWTNPKKGGDNCTRNVIE